MGKFNPALKLFISWTFFAGCVYIRSKVWIEFVAASLALPQKVSEDPTISS
jgi:hypothetical protein